MGLKLILNQQGQTALSEEDGRWAQMVKKKVRGGKWEDNRRKNESVFFKL